MFTVDTSHLRVDQGRPAFGTFSIVGDKLVGNGAVGVGETASHGGHHQPVLQSQLIDACRRKKSGIWHHNFLRGCLMVSS